MNGDAQTADTTDDDTLTYGSAWGWWELAALSALAVLATAPFWLSDLDLHAAAAFYHPDHPTRPWQEGDGWLWQALYAAPLVLGSVGLVAGGAWLAAGIAHGRDLWRRYGLCLLLSISLGPGLVVNLVFKDNWGRPRPNQIVAFGGRHDYLPPLALGERGTGKSFPAGHPSIAFALAAAAAPWRRRRRWLGFSLAAPAVLLGAGIGLGRMVAGGHFLSDVLWSAVLTWAVIAACYHLVLRIPACEDAGKPARAWSPWARRLATATMAVAALGILAGLLVATPVYKRKDLLLGPAEQAATPRRFAVLVERGDLALRLARPGHQPFLHLTSVHRGFGLPTAEIVHLVEARQMKAEDLADPLHWLDKRRQHSNARTPAPESLIAHQAVPVPDDLETYALTCIVRADGLFTELSGRVEVDLDPARFDLVVLVTEDGRLDLPDHLPPGLRLVTAEHQQ